MIKTTKKLGEILIQDNAITQEQLETALNSQKVSKARLGDILVKSGYITYEQIARALGRQLNIPIIDLADVEFQSNAINTLPLALLERYIMIPVRISDRKLVLAVADPTNFYALDDARIASGMEIELAIATQKSIEQAIANNYGIHSAVAKDVSRLKAEDFAISTQEVTPETSVEDAPIINIVNSLLEQAVRRQASDIHIENLENRLRVRFRIDGVLQEMVTFPTHMHLPILSRIKIMGGMNIAEKRIPQDGRLQIAGSNRSIDVRISTFPTITGEKIVMRILDKGQMQLDVNVLDFSRENLTAFRELYSSSYGMMLLTGPTGSGKTTTVYSVMTEINSPEKNIITVEDPIEYRLEGINQSQVNIKAGMTFANGLRSILRQDPDIIMVGEIRDRETAEIAIRAALTGHFVLSTLHTNNAIGTMSRLIDMGVEPFLVASSILGAVSQRLLRRICKDCKTEITLDPNSTEALFLKASGFDLPQTTFIGKGCPYCNNTGYKGRIAVHEVLRITPEIRSMVMDRMSTDDMLAVAQTQGYTTMRSDAINKALAGITTISEIIRVAYTIL